MACAPPPRPYVTSAATKSRNMNTCIILNTLSRGLDELSRNQKEGAPLSPYRAAQTIHKHRIILMFTCVPREAGTSPERLLSATGAVCSMLTKSKIVINRIRSVSVAVSVWPCASPVVSRTPLRPAPPFTCPRYDWQSRVPGAPRPSRSALDQTDALDIHMHYSFHDLLLVVVFACVVAPDFDGLDELTRLPGAVGPLPRRQERSLNS